ncbi:response regulator transcription factor [Taibaiella helva]|uniref:response regulator transcription factor n=1 Tax=Taibaiella helva TaxID=2301235 RepID=UPI0018E52B5B|nr:response regulator transcription factor [Taibaiella helva]
MKIAVSTRGIDSVGKKSWYFYKKVKMVSVSVIDDNKMIRDSITQLLALHRDEFETAGVYESAVAFLNSLIIRNPGQIHILLLDIGLPRLSGLDAIPLILEKVPDINIVMLTTYEEEDVILKALCSGAYAYISKRSGLDDIMAALRIVATGGSYMSPSIAREIVNHLMGGHVSKASILSERQREILQKLVDGKSYQTIASELFLSVETTLYSIKKIYKVLHVNNKTETIAQYLRGFIH